MHATLRIIITAALLGLSSVLADAQRLGWSTAGHIGFVFGISNNEAQKLLTKPKSDSIFRRLMHTQVDTFLVSKGWTHRPSKGHFILAHIVENQLRCEYVGILPYQVFLFREYNSLTLQVIDREGNVRSDARVRLKHDRIRFDTTTHTYRINDGAFYGERHYVSVELDGFRSFFEVLRKERPYWGPSYYQDDGPDFYSYMITDKNRYRPGDKLRFKSYALSGARSPLQKPLELWLTGSGKRIRVKSVDPHRPGSYADEFVLDDSLKLRLDQHYTLALHDRHARIVASCHFKYEDYELNNDRLDVSLERNQYHPHPNTLRIRATDVNGLPLAGARVRIVVRPQQVLETFQPVLYVADTLLYEERQVEYAVDTEVPIPATLFGKANVEYSVDVTLVSNKNQLINKTVAAVYHHRQYEITAMLKNDSIIYKLSGNGDLMRNVAATLSQGSVGDGTSITLPYRERINPTIAEATVSTSYGVRTINMESLLPKMEIQGGIDVDTFKVDLFNPHKLPVTWNIYQGSQVVAHGYGINISHRSIINDRSLSYYVEVLYAFGGKDRIVQKEYRFNDKALTIDLQLPSRVHPGETVDALIHVTNQSGAPVSGVDLTALASNSKLGYIPSGLPDYGTLSAKRSEAPTFDKFGLHSRTATLPLDYTFWAERAGLDTMKYYQLLYPETTLFSNEVPIGDSTQFSVYVMQKGRTRKVFVVEVNHNPVYFSWVSGPLRYAHYVTPNRIVQVAVRLHDRMLLFDSLCFNRGRKTILSVDLDHLPANVTVLMLDDGKPRRSRQRYSHFTVTEVARYTKLLSAFHNISQRSYLDSESQFVPLAGGGRLNQYQVVGPVIPEYLQYVDGDRKLSFRIKGGSAYAFEDNVIYREPAVNLMPQLLVDDRQFNPSLTLDDLVLTREEYLRQEHYQPTDKWITRDINIVERTRKLSIALPEDKDRIGIYTVLYEDPVSGRITSACPLWEQRSRLFVLPDGRLDVIVLYNDGRYFRMKNVQLKPGQHTYVDFNHSKIFDANDSSARWREKAMGNCFDRTPVHTRTLHYPSRRVGYDGNIRGTILDEAGMPIPGVNVVVKGTEIGTVTDIDGSFILDIYDGYATLLISFIGYQTQEADVRAGSVLSLQLTPDVTQLQEVIVTAYGASVSKSLTGSATRALEGRIPGVQITNRDESDLMDQEAAELNQEAERQLYHDLMTITRIRSNFTDVAFWEPKLFTDRKGRARFRVTFPDDITQWDAVVLAMNRRLQTGITRSSVRSYKPIMAELDVPRFLVTGDSAFAHATVSNHSSEKSITGVVRWNTQGTSFDSTLSMTQFRKYLLPMQGTGPDSVEAKFLFQRDDGYTDGELRRVPVIEKGTLRAAGTLTILNNGDQQNVVSRDNESIDVELIRGPLDIWTSEARQLINYKYACNEQLASKLLGLIAHLYITKYEEKEFPHDRQVRDIIQRLLENQNTEFLWSWWNVSDNTSYWISAHILRALKAASDAGYRVNLNVDNITRKATYKYEMLDSFDRSDADLLEALAEWNAPLDYSRYADRIDTLLKNNEEYFIRTKRSGYALMKDRLLLAEVRQLAGLPFDRSIFSRYRHEGARGEMFLSDGREYFNWYSDDLSANTVAYRIVRRDSALRAEMLLPMQLYFLSQRAANAWNTYHASNVLVSLLPDLLAMGVTRREPVRISLTGTALKNRTIDSRDTIITSLPFRVKVCPSQRLSIQKQAGLPVYLMQYQEQRVTQANAAGDAFEIRSFFVNNTNRLVAGRRTKLIVNVDVMKDVKAEYVMIEIPVPASCSYTNDDKRSPLETHREYYKDRVNIYFERLSIGSHRFEIDLLPRFSGVFHLNPAQVSLMYFPVINANNDMTVVRVSD